MTTATPTIAHAVAEDLAPALDALGFARNGQVFVRKDAILEVKVRGPAAVVQVWTNGHPVTDDEGRVYSTRLAARSLFAHTDISFPLADPRCTDKLAKWIEENLDLQTSEEAHDVAE